MTRVMYDSVSVGTIPTDAGAVLGYIGPVRRDNRFVTFPELVRRFPHANKLSLATHADLDAEGLDIENFDAVPDQFPAWHRRQVARGAYKPVAYGPRDTIPTVIAHINAAGIPRSEYRILSAHVGHGPHICSPQTCGASFTADGTQWTFTALGRNLDESLISDSFFPPAPRRRKPRPRPHKKTLGAGAGATVGTAILAALHQLGIAHLTPAESGAITAFTALVASWAAPPGYIAPRRR